MADKLADNRVVIGCSYAVPTDRVAAGAHAYVTQVPGNPRRINIVAQALGGRWIGLWELPQNLTQFHLETLQPSHPLYDDPRVATQYDTAHGSVLVSSLNND